MSNLSVTLAKAVKINSSNFSEDQKAEQFPKSLIESVDGRSIRTLEHKKTNFAF